MQSAPDDKATLMIGGSCVRVASSTQGDPGKAAQAVFAALDAPTLAGMIVFCADRDGLTAMAREAALHAPDLTVIGCTTAGEITPWGSRQGTVTAAGFVASEFSILALRFDDLLDFDPFAAHRAVAGMIGEAEAKAAYLGAELERAALFLIDGLSCREELLTHTMRHLLDDIPMIGGSAGDGMQFRRTYLLHNGEVRSDCAILLLLSSTRRLRVFRAHHHVAGEKLAVITRADAATRKVLELNGEPAAKEYTRLAGGVSASTFAAHPLMVRVGGTNYARAVMRADEDDSLIIHSAIERGLVLRLGHSTDMLRSIETAMEQCDDTRSGFDAVIAFDSVQNVVEAQAAGLSEEVADIYRRNCFVGFHTYGEQFRDLHLNRSLLGLAIGKRP